jgi:hypothetical protein
VGGDDGLANGETQPQAVGLRGAEGFEHTVQFGFGDAFALVDHGKFQRAVTPCFDLDDLAPKGAIPRGTIVSVTEITARVKGIESSSRTVSVRGPSGELRKYAVGPEVARFDCIRVDDSVVLRYTEALGFRMIQDK